MSAENNPAKDQEKKPAFTLQKVYLKDLSFESPRQVESLLKPAERADVEFQLSTETRKVTDSVYEALLTITVTARKEETVLYLVEVKQAGLFMLKDFPEQELEAILKSYCPGVLYPYAREVVSGMVERGGFPQLLLKPVNFDAIYMQHLERQTQETVTA